MSLKGKLKLRTGAKEWQERFFVLDKEEQTLCECLHRGAKPVRTITLSAVSLRETPNGLKKHSFIISRPDRADIVLAADNEKTCSKWKSAINEIYKQTVVTMMDLEKFKDPCIVFNTDFVALDINRSAHTLFGFTQSECKDKSLSSILVDDEEMKQLVASLTGSSLRLHIGQYRSVRAKGQDSNTLSLMMCINRLIEGEETHFLAVFALPIEQFDDFPAATLCSNAVGNIVEVNQKFLNMIGLTRTQLLPKQVPFAIPGFAAKQKGQSVEQYIASRNLLGSPFKTLAQRSNGTPLSMIVWIGSWEEDGCVRYIATLTPSTRLRRRSSAFKFDRLKRGDARSSFSEALRTTATERIPSTSSLDSLLSSPHGVTSSRKQVTFPRSDSSSSSGDRSGSTSSLRSTTGSIGGCASNEDFTPRDDDAKAATTESLAAIYTCLMRLQAAVPALEQELQIAREKQASTSKQSSHGNVTSWDSVWKRASILESDVGDIIMEAKEPAPALFRVKQGCVAVSAGDGPVLKQLGPGSIIGKQIAFDPDAPAQITAVVMTEGAEIEALTAEDIQDVMEKEPAVGMCMLRQLGSSAMTLVHEIALMVDPSITPRLNYV